MIYYLVTRRHAYTMRSFIDTWAKELLPRVKVLSYESLPYSWSPRQGTYIFSDIERLTLEQAESLSRIWEELATAESGIRLLNHPMQSMRRYELLRALCERGFNNFNVYRLAEVRMPERFPVFIRGENDHGGSLTPLLETPQALSVAIDEISRRSGLKDKVMIEFCNTADSNGTFRKYSAYIVGDRIFPQHMMFGQGWMLKSVINVARKKAELYEERHYLRNNPHESQLRAVFQLAGIDYGRIDYGMLDDKPQIWEINTNPTLMHISPGPPRCGAERVQFVRKMISILEELDYEVNANVMIPVKSRMSRFTACSGLKAPHTFALAFILDRYYYLRQCTVPRTRRRIQNALPLINASLKRLKGIVSSNECRRS